LKGTEGYSPVIYLHWHGNQVNDFLYEAMKLMESRGEDLHYATARLIGVCHNQIVGNTSLGVMHLPERFAERVRLEGDEYLRHESHGDAGLFLVDISDPTWPTKCYGGYGLGHNAGRPIADDGTEG